MKSKIINSADAQSFRSIAKQFEFETNNLTDYQIRAIYFGEARFDFYPKSKKIFDLRKKTWIELNQYFGNMKKSWKDDLKTFLTLQILE